MRSLLFTLATLISLSIFSQSIPACFKKPDGELKVLFTSVYKIKTVSYTHSDMNDPSKPKHKDVGDIKGTYHKTDKSMLDDNQLLLQEWYKLLKAKLEKMRIAAPANFGYVNMQNPVEGVKEMQKVIDGAKQWFMVTCNDLSKAQKANKKGTLSLESFSNVVISIQCANGKPYVKRGKNLAAILDKVEKDL